MHSIKPLPEFTAWLNGLKDGMTHRRLAGRLEKAQKDNLGDVKSVGGGVFEMREHFGPGWRQVGCLAGGLNDEQENQNRRSARIRHGRAFAG